MWFPCHVSGVIQRTSTTEGYEVIRKTVLRPSLSRAPLQSIRMVIDGGHLGFDHIRVGHLDSAADCYPIVIYL